MIDRKSDALVPSSRAGLLEKTPTGDLVTRVLADIEALQAARDEVVVFPAQLTQAFYVG